MNIGERIKKVRRDLNMTQTEFASRIGSVQNTVTGYESGRRNPSAPVITLICKEFNVNEEWLRTGEGEMFIPDQTDILNQLAKKYRLSNAAYVMVEKFINLQPEIQNKIFDYFHEVDAALSKDDADPYAPALTANAKSDSVQPKASLEELSDEEKLKLYADALKLEREAEEKSKALQKDA